MPSRVRFTLPPSPIRPANFEYAFEPVSTRTHLSSPSASFDSTLETLHEDSELEFHHSFDPLERVEENEESMCVMPLPRSSERHPTYTRKPLTSTHNRRVEEDKKDKKGKE